MPRLSNRLRGRAVPAVLIVSVVVAATAAISAGVAGSTTSHRARSATVIPLDHFLCYTAKSVASTPIPLPFSDTAAAVSLQNSIYPAGVLAGVGLVTVHCNPVAKSIVTAAGTTTYPINEPASHLVCWIVRPNRQTPPLLRAYIVANQFGQATVTPGAMQNLCLPSFKDENNPANLPPGPDAQPSDLNHFACFTITNSGTFTAPGVVQLADQFVGSGTPLTVKIGKPKLLCLPTLKTVDPATPPTPLVDNGTLDSLLCVNIAVSKATPAPVPKVVYAENQFGEGAVDAMHTATLCLPSSAQPGPAGS
jgi:hypothetical protein